MNSPATNSPATSGQYPSHRYAWFMVVMLTIAYIFSYIDRYILGLLAESIKADLQLTDTQMGLLLGPAFGLVYAVMGLPIGWLADHKRRTWIVAAGVGLWSLATAMTGLAKTFWHVFIARMSVGVGEASLNPCTMSMISDSFPPERRGKPIAFYTAALSLGAGVASLITAGVLSWAKSVPQIEFGPFGELAPWQFIFIAMGLPGLVLALIFLFLKEPQRARERNNTQANGKNVKGTNLIAMIKYVLSRGKPFYGIFALQTAMMLMAYAQGWMAPTFERTWGWSPEKYVFINAWVLLAVGPLTVNLTGWLSDRLYKKGRREAPYLLLFYGLCILVPTGVLATLMPNGELAFVLLAVNTVGIAMASAVGVTALINITPDSMRAQVVALYYMVTGLLATQGPLVVGLMTDHVFGEAHLNYAMSMAALVFGVPAILYGLYAKRFYVQELYEKEMG